MLRDDLNSASYFPDFAGPGEGWVSPLPILCPYLRLIPNPILRRLHRKKPFVFERVREVVPLGVAIHKKNRRNEVLAVGRQHGRRDGCRTVCVMPVIIVVVPKGRGLVEENEA